MLNESFNYQDGLLRCEGVSLLEIAEEFGTPTYIYSRPRIEANYRRVTRAFASLNAHIHYSAKANGNIEILRLLIEAGAGVDVVSGGEIHRALLAGAHPQQIVFAGVGKTQEELSYAVQKGVGWINVENPGELPYLEALAVKYKREKVRVALRLNPGVTANTHPYIATGHGSAKFGMTAEAVSDLLANQDMYAHIEFAGIHVHIGSQLHDTGATVEAVEAALEIAKQHAIIHTMNIGGGLPVAYEQSEQIPQIETFASDLASRLREYKVILEPGRSIVADAGALLARVLYVKWQAGQTFVIVDASMNELLRPALYQAHHDIVPVVQAEAQSPVQIVGPVCETADVLGHDVPMPVLQPGDLVAILTTGAYGAVMAGNYNARPRPAEVLIGNDETRRIIGRRERWVDMTAREVGDE